MSGRVCVEAVKRVEEVAAEVEEGAVLSVHAVYPESGEHAVAFLMEDVVTDGRVLRGRVGGQSVRVGWDGSVWLAGLSCGVVGVLVEVPDTPVGGAQGDDL